METNGANLQADAAIHELTSNGIAVDFHLSGAMSNRKVANDATPTTPVDLKISDMFTLMPYENSLVVISMNGPQLKTVLERAYRNYYYYKYVPGYGGYSYYTTCMLDTNFGNVITYNDISEAPYDPSKSYVGSLNIGGHEVDFEDADTYYNVSTVNYLAAGSCNFNDGGETCGRLTRLWPIPSTMSVMRSFTTLRIWELYHLRLKGVCNSYTILTRLKSQSIHQLRWSMYSLNHSRSITQWRMWELLGCGRIGQSWMERK